MAGGGSVVVITPPKVVLGHTLSGGWKHTLGGWLWKPAGIHMVPVKSGLMTPSLVRRGISLQMS